VDVGLYSYECVCVSGRVGENCAARRFLMATHYVIRQNEIIEKGLKCVSAGYEKYGQNDGRGSSGDCKPERYGLQRLVAVVV
jgi:hypothetical protein